MAILTIAGICKKRGDGDYGPWYVIAETITPKSGKTFEKRYIVGGTKDSPAPREGDYGVATGYMRDGVREHEGKWYPDTKLNAASWTALDEGHAQSAPAAVDDDGDIPFRSPERIHTVTRVDGHEHHRARRAIRI